MLSKTNSTIVKHLQLRSPTRTFIFSFFTKILIYHVEKNKLLSKKKTLHIHIGSQNPFGNSENVLTESNLCDEDFTFENHSCLVQL